MKEVSITTNVNVTKEVWDWAIAEIYKALVRKEYSYFDYFLNWNKLASDEKEATAFQPDNYIFEHIYKMIKECFAIDCVFECEIVKEIRDLDESRIIKFLKFIHKCRPAQIEITTMIYDCSEEMEILRYW